VVSDGRTPLPSHPLRSRPSCRGAPRVLALASVSCTTPDHEGFARRHVAQCGNRHQGRVFERCSTRAARRPCYNVLNSSGPWQVTFEATQDLSIPPLRHVLLGRYWHGVSRRGAVAVRHEIRRVPPGVGRVVRAVLHPLHHGDELINPAGPESPQFTPRFQPLAGASDTYVTSELDRHGWAAGRASSNLSVSQGETPPDSNDRPLRSVTGAKRPNAVTEPTYPLHGCQDTTCDSSS
jgi:hypothetical protein